MFSDDLMCLFYVKCEQFYGLNVYAKCMFRVASSFTNGPVCYVTATSGKMHSKHFFPVESLIHKLKCSGCGVEGRKKNHK